MARLLLAFLLCVSLLTTAAQADLAGSLLSEYHSHDELGIVVVTGGQPAELSSLLLNQAHRIVVLQIPFERYDHRCTPVLLQWVRQGHALWFYDSRYAPLFGMKRYALHSDQFRGKPEDGTIGSAKYAGMAATVMGMDGHPVTTGVGQATVFLPELEKGTYSAVAVEGDTVALLRFAHDSPALAALRRDGRGVIVFKPLLWVKSLSGERFQMNLLEYSAGFGVPGSAGFGRIGLDIGPEAPSVEGNPAVPIVEAVSTGSADNARSAQSMPAKLNNKAAAEAENSDASQREDVLTLAGGEKLRGWAAIEVVRFETGSSSLRLEAKDVQYIDVGGSVDLDHLVTLDGKTYVGYWLVDKLNFTGSDGSHSYGRAELDRLDLNVRVQPNL